MFSTTPVTARSLCSFAPKLIITALILTLPGLASAASGNELTVEQLQQQIIELQQESARKLEELKAQTDRQLQLLQAQIDQMSASSQLAANTPANQPQQAPAPAAASKPSRLDQLTVSGDFRLRYENNSSWAQVPSWDRGAMRGRLAARYQLTEQISLGARLATGDPDNPRTTDVTLGDFVSDLDFSLDQAYADYKSEGWMLTGGKFAKPFSSTELVWDGDVNPQGIGGKVDLFKGNNLSAQFSGLYFLINEDIYLDSSDMLGGQFTLSGSPGGNWAWALHAAYFDYDIGTLNPGVPGGARGNNLVPGSLSYLSDFNLFDTMASLSYDGFGERWKVTLIADYVHNLGAETEQDTGYGFDLFVGTLAHPGDWLFRYGYSQAETDAVLGMFSNDNIFLPTNYELHTFAVDYALLPHTFLSLIHYEFQQLDSNAGDLLFDNSWASRTRLNLYFTF